MNKPVVELELHHKQQRLLHHFGKQISWLHRVSGIKNENQSNGISNIATTTHLREKHYSLEHIKPEKLVLL